MIKESNLTLKNNSKNEKKFKFPSHRENKLVVEVINMTKTYNRKVHDKTQKRFSKQNIHTFFSLNNKFIHPDKVYASKNVNLSVYKGEKIGIIGANGAGKTTIVEVIAGLIKPSSGKVKYYFEGLKQGKNPKECIGLQFQNNRFPEGLRVKNIIDYFANIFKLNVETIYAEYVPIFQLEDLLNSDIQKLSGGQKQRLNAMCSIMHNPELIILDEISNGLDILGRYKITQFILKIIKEFNSTLIAISHNMSEIEELCDRVITVRKGEIVDDLPMKEIEDKYSNLQNFVDQSFLKVEKENIDND